MSLSIGSKNNFELSEPENIAKQIIDHEKDEYQKERLKMKADDPFLELLRMDDSDWENKNQLYCKIERFIRDNEDKIPTWQVAGPLHYGMTLSKMQTIVKQQFLEMATSGRLMTEKSLVENHNRVTFYPTDNKRSNNLTRIWGAEFLKSNLPNDSSLDATEHYLIIDNDATEIEVQVWCADYPVLSRVNNAYILSKKIEGHRRAWDYRFSTTLDKLKYRDFKDPGNILRDSNGTGWIVDTEIKSFDPPSLNRNLAQIQNYLKKRFELLSGNDSLCRTFKISITDMNLSQ